MITRPVRVNFPCSYLSLINFRSQLGKTAVIKDEKKPEEKPFVWMPSMSQLLVANQASSVVKKLDINAVVRNKLEEDLNLTVYSVVSNCSPVAAVALHEHRKQSGPFQSRDQLLNNILPHRDQLLTGMLKKCKESSTKINNSKDIFRSGNLCQCNNDVASKRKPDKDGKHLPSNQQLDEMMAYFVTQAPALFASAGWTYQKATYNIIFENMMFGSYKTQSLNSYIMHINMLRFFTRMILKNPELGIFHMTKSLNEGRIDIRWQVNGTPRTLMKPFVFLGLWNGYIDGSSIFYINSCGLYYRHILMNMTLLPGPDNQIKWPSWIRRLRRRVEVISSSSSRDGSTK